MTKIPSKKNIANIYKSISKETIIFYFGKLKQIKLMWDQTCNNIMIDHDTLYLCKTLSLSTSSITQIDIYLASTSKEVGFLSGVSGAECVKIRNLCVQIFNKAIRFLIKLYLAELSGIWVLTVDIGCIVGDVVYKLT